MRCLPRPRADHYTGCSHVNAGLEHLDRHNVDCGSGRALQKWHLGDYGCSGSDKQIYYRCAELGHIGAPQYTDTTTGDISGYGYSQLAIDTLDACKDACSADSSCTAIKFSASAAEGADLQCILYDGTVAYDDTLAVYKDYYVHIKSDKTPSPPKKCPAGYEEYEWDYNVQGYTSYGTVGYLATTPYKIESCKEKCDTQEACIGFEFSSNPGYYKPCYAHTRMSPETRKVSSKWTSCRRVTWQGQSCYDQRYNSGCESRNELGTYHPGDNGKTRADCEALCDSLCECVSWEYSKDSVCKLSSSCTFDAATSCEERPLSCGYELHVKKSECVPTSCPPPPAPPPALPPPLWSHCYQKEAGRTCPGRGHTLLPDIPRTRTFCREECDKSCACTSWMFKDDATGAGTGECELSSTCTEALTQPSEHGWDVYLKLDVCLQGNCSVAGLVGIGRSGCVEDESGGLPASPSSYSPSSYSPAPEEKTEIHYDSDVTGAFGGTCCTAWLTAGRGCRAGELCCPAYHRIDENTLEDGYVEVDGQMTWPDKEEKRGFELPYTMECPQDDKGLHRQSCSPTMWDLVGTGWTLVRRVAPPTRTHGVYPSPTWHPATDRLAGTDVYGSKPCDEVAAQSTKESFSIAFQSIPFDEFLFATGDGAKCTPRRPTPAPRAARDRCARVAAQGSSRASTPSTPRVTLATATETSSGPRVTPPAGTAFPTGSNGATDDPAPTMALGSHSPTSASTPPTTIRMPAASCTARGPSPLPENRARSTI